MTTNKIVLSTVDQFMAGYKSIYSPMYPQFLAGGQAYPAEVGELNFKRIDTVGDIRAHRMTPKDTEVRQIAVSEGSKVFKKYFFANQFIISSFQDARGIDDVTAKVLDEHHVQFDELLLGDGVNNGLYTSSDANYVLEQAAATLDDTNAEATKMSFHEKIMVTADKANQIAGRKLLLIYGAAMVPIYLSMLSASGRSVRAVLQESLTSEYVVATMPTRATPSGANGWIVANFDQTKLHYTMVPTIESRGVNEEKMYAWNNFVMGSCMLECLVEGAVIRQGAQVGS